MHISPGFLFLENKNKKRRGFQTKNRNLINSDFNMTKKSKTILNLDKDIYLSYKSNRINNSAQSNIICSQLVKTNNLFRLNQQMPTCNLFPCLNKQNNSELIFSNNKEYAENEKQFKASSTVLPIIKDQITTQKILIPQSINLKFYSYIVYPDNCGYLIKKCLDNRINWKESYSQITTVYNFKWKDCTKGIDYESLSITPSLKQFVNHFEYHSALSNKAKMFMNMMKYCEETRRNVFNYLPLTFILTTTEDIEFSNNISNFKKVYETIQSFLSSSPFFRTKPSYASMFINKTQLQQKIGERTPIIIHDSHYNFKNYWIIKTPNLNRGRCIQIIDSFQKLMQYIYHITNGELSSYPDTQQKEKDNLNYICKTIIIQKYIERPLLYYQRKFDIRIWVLITHNLEAFVFKEGHLKTCSVHYDIGNNNSYVHITNYSLQKHNENFSKFEMGNEVSFSQFQEFLNYCYSKKNINVQNNLFPQFKEIIKISCQSVKDILNQNKKRYCFEIFGYDFMMDEDFNAFLIEINTNPGLEESSILIKTLVPRMLDDALRLTIDKVFNPIFREELNDSDGNYISPYHIDEYKDNENLWEFVCDLKEKKKKKY